MRTELTRGAGRRLRWLRLVAVAVLAAPAAVAGQDANILFPVDTIEKRLAHDHFEIIDQRGSRFEGDRTSRVALDFGAGGMLVAQWARAPVGGSAFNNNPHYELAAYEIQKLFLEPHQYVVPPTVVRAFPLDWYQRLDPQAGPTLHGTASVLVVLQYWLFSVTGDDFWDADRFAADSVYARHMATFNLFTYLIRHNDQNVGNYLVSTNPDNPRVFSVDNGLAFESEMSDQGARWRRIRVDRLPADVIERLRELTEEDVTRHMETLVQFRVRPDGTLAPEEPGPSIDPRSGVRHHGDVVQLGLPARDIRNVWRRIQRLLDDVDDGDYELF